MKTYLFLIFINLFIFGCGSLITIRKISPVGKFVPIKKKVTMNNDSKESINYTTEKSEVKNNDPEIVQKIIKEAESYLGTPYLLGGSSRDGIDCSSFVSSCFLKVGIKLPRTSQSQSTYGERIKKDKITKGDLLFFATGSNKNIITHVGIVYEVTKNDISFIHASTSKGVRIDNLSNSYWNPKFLFSNRIIK